MIDGMRQSLRDWLDGVEGLDLVAGSATLVGDPEGRAHQVTVGGETHSTGKVYLDVGGRAALPSIEGLDQVDHLTEVELLQLTELPSHLIVVGGGYIGLEFGQMFRRFGAEVTILAGGGIAAREDADVVDALTEILTGEGVSLRNTRPERVARTDEGIRVELADGSEPVTGSPPAGGHGPAPQPRPAGTRPRAGDRRAGLRRPSDPGSRPRCPVSGRWATSTVTARSPTPRTRTARSCSARRGR